MPIPSPTAALRVRGAEARTAEGTEALRVSIPCGIMLLLLPDLLSNADDALRNRDALKNSIQITSFIYAIICT